MEYKARENAVPMRGTFELTPLCNLNCKMCYVHLSKQQLEHQPGGLLTGKQWIRIIEQAINMGLLEVTLTGGEALLHPDFDEILLFLEANHIEVNLKTNGLLLSEERVSFLKAHHLGSIQISLYGCDEDSYEKVTGHRAYTKTMAAIDRVHKAGIPLEIVITPSRYMWDGIERLLEMVHSLGIRYKVNPGLVEPLEETGRAGIDHDLSLDQYIELNKMMVKLNSAILVPTCIEELPRPGGFVTAEAKGIRCAAGRSMFAVTWNGWIHPCRMLEKIGFDGKEKPFESGWHEMNKCANAYPVPSECVGCVFEGACPVCVIQHEYGAEPGHANPTICQRALRMAAEGLYTRKKVGG